MNKDCRKGFFTGTLLTVAVVYSISRIDMILTAGLDHIRWYDTFSLYLIIATLFFGISYRLYKQGMLNSPSARKAYLIVFGLFAGFYLAEIGLSVLKIETTYSETREGIFVNPADRTQKTWYMTWMPHHKWLGICGELCIQKGDASYGI